MSSAKLQVRPILLKKISFMIFFNNYLSDYGAGFLCDSPAGRARRGRLRGAFEPKVKYTGIIKAIRVETSITKEPLPYVDLRSVKTIE